MSDKKPDDKKYFEQVATMLETQFGNVERDAENRRLTITVDDHVATLDLAQNVLCFLQYSTDFCLI